MKKLPKCKYCNSSLEWCDCGECHRVYCPNCNMLIDNTNIDCSTLKKAKKEMIKKLKNKY